MADILAAILKLVLGAIIMGFKDSGSHLQSQNVRLDNKYNGMKKVNTMWELSLEIKKWKLTLGRLAMNK